MSLEQTEDLKAFERRLTEVIDKLQPAARFWRIILILISICTAMGAWRWLWDPDTSQVAFMQSLLNHPFFTLSCLFLAMLFLCGIHKRVVAPSIIASRCRQVLADYNMSCDDVAFMQSLLNHPFFTLSCLFLAMLFLCGIHKRVVAPSIIASRCRQVFADYNMSCDDTGKLILKPRPTT